MKKLESLLKQHGFYYTVNGDKIEVLSGYNTITNEDVIETLTVKDGELYVDGKHWNVRDWFGY